MAPEQQAAFAAVGAAGQRPAALDGRADVYSLGLVLYEMLGGPVPPPPGKHAPLYRFNPEAPVGLADILARCLSPSPHDRYASAADLAADLRRQLADLPLVGVRNRSLLERWRKWRRRRPNTLILGTLLAAVLTATAAATALFVLHLGQQRDAAGTALAEGQRQLQQDQFADALVTPATRTIRRRSAAGERRPEAPARRRGAPGRTGAGRPGVASDSPTGCASSTTPPCRRPSCAFSKGSAVMLWDRRDEILGRLQSDADPQIREQIQADLLDLAILWTDLRVRLAPAEDAAETRREALEVLERAEDIFGPSPVLQQERRIHARALG